MHKTHVLSILITCLTILSGWAQVVVTDKGLTRNGQPYFIKGVGGDEDIHLLSKLGANSIRTWSDTGLAELLNTAEKHNITVCAGIWLEHDCSWFSYSNPDHCAKQLARVEKIIRTHMHHKALLLWNIGNESEGDGTNAHYWIQINKLCAMAHAIDPAHPTINAVAGLHEAKAAAIMRHCPDLDIIGINTYAALHGLRQHLDTLQWKKPWIVTEFGPQGFWERPKTSWDRPIEQNSTSKADTIRKNYQRAISPGGPCLGSYAFVWGHKQEATSTWFGLRDAQGNVSASINALQHLWTGQLPANLAPVTTDISCPPLKKPLPPKQTNTASITATDPEGQPLTIRWTITSDAIRRGENGREIPPSPINGLITDPTKPTITFHTPEKPGIYRLFAHITDPSGHFATANLPFSVK